MSDGNHKPVIAVSSDWNLTLRFPKWWNYIDGQLAGNEGIFPGCVDFLKSVLPV